MAPCLALLVAFGGGAAIGCSDDAGGTDPTAADTAIEADGTDDLASPDAADIADVGALVWTCDGFGGPGCGCDTADDCSSGYCIDTPDDGRICTEPCSSTCPTHYACVPATGSDLVYLCLPKWPVLCNPCDADSDCASVGSGKANCVDRGPIGAFCGAACANDLDCPTGYRCVTTTSVEGKQAKQCQPLPDDDGNAVDCTCSGAAKTAQLGTSCAAKAEGSTGLCKGVRQCMADGLSGCSAVVSPEVCNGEDDDCNGKIDDKACEDDNPCTTDLCDAVKMACDHTATAGSCDADNNACSVGDTCISGVCTPGPQVSCDDKNPCSQDFCDPATGCAHTQPEGLPCEDDNPCTIGDVCQDGQCQPGKPKLCTAPDGCQTAACSLETGKCAYGAAPDMTPCDDGLLCTAMDGCVGGVCKGKPKTCDDNNPCTQDACDPKQGCVVQPQGQVACDDGNACTGPDSCTQGVCGGAAKTCDDGNPCTTDSCNPEAGCTHANNSAACDDGNPCSDGDACANGQCEPGKSTCACEVDADCPDDGNLCNGLPFCDKSGGPGAHACKIKPGTVVQCDTSADTGCQQTLCVTKTGQCDKQNATAGTACEDGSACTQGDACQGGQCQSGQALVCDDKNPCTTDSCDPGAGCKHLALDGPACDADGSVCTQGDQCQAGVCTKGKSMVCDDGNPCSDDSCDAKVGCLQLNNTAPCDDGSPCSQGDACANGQCVPGKSVCACQKDVDCPDDGNLCNGLQFCDKSAAPYQCKQKPGSVVQCDASKDDACQTSACNAKTGACAMESQPDAKSCTDGSACTSGDACQAGKCVPGAMVPCDDANSCTSDSCDPGKGCVFTPTPDVTFACYSGPGGTQGKGACKSGKKTCDAVGVLGPCLGEILPAQAELCDGLDDTCNGQTDEGCKAQGVEVGFPAVRYVAEGAKYRTDIRLSQSAVSGAATGSGNVAAWWGAWRWWKAVWPW